MPLQNGARLGPYEIISPLGAGGMGEVYKARDTRLDRTVAIKVLPADVANDPDLRARFEREARAIAALDHPHICAIYDVGEAQVPAGTGSGHEPSAISHDVVRFLVMQHLDGETLAARLARTNGPLPLDQVLKTAIEIADALDKAHRAGITHRDLKPANIMLTKSGAKLLDFGLAKLRGPAAPISMSGMTRLAMTASNTAHGTILGTMHYMAPERVEGREADARSDIWALGAVIYEMATGKRPFDGESPASIIGAILKDAPQPISSRQPLVPPILDHIVSRCLEKDPDERWQSAADLMRELRWADASRKGGTAAPDRPAHRFIQRQAWIGGAIGVISTMVIAAILARSSREEARPAPVMRFAVTPPPNTMFASPPATVPSTQLALSPDGRWLVFVAESAGSDAMLWIRPIDGVAAQPLAGTEEASYPFWAPDSHAIGFFAQGKLKRIDVPAGAPQTLCDAADPRGGAWSRDNVIVFGLSQTGLLRVSATGGEPAAATALDRTETSHRWPSFLPDGRHVIFFSLTQSRADSFVGIASLDNSERVQLFRAQYAASYVTTGNLLFMSNGLLIAQPFDPVRRMVTGEPTTIAQDVTGSSVNYGSFSASSTGLLAFAAASDIQMQLAWFARDGKRITNVGPAGDYADVQLSPDDRRALVTRVEPKTATSNILTVDLSTGVSSPLTFGSSFVSAQPVWPPDGREVVFRSQRELPAPLFRRLASGAGKDELVLRPRESLPDAPNVFPTDWSADGRFILFHGAFRDTGYDVWALPLTGDRKPRPFVRTRADDVHGRFSPDGRFVAYSSTESGRAQIYVQPFPGADGRWQVSTQGGAEPRWSANGRELFFLSADFDHRRCKLVKLSEALTSTCR